jgi:hypothetical protein
LWFNNLHGNRFLLYRNYFAFAPLVSFSYWFTFHVVGAIGLFSGTSAFTIWNLWSQFSMLVLDGFIIIALLKKTRIGFYTAFGALLILTGEILVCSTLAMLNVITTPVKFGAGVGLAMCLLSICALIMTKNNYYRHFQGIRLADSSKRPV